MNWHDAVKSSEGYWKPTERSWKFWEMCCMGDSQTQKVPDPESPKFAIYNKEKRIAHYWSKEDDRKLCKLVEKYNFDWDAISEKFSDKTASQLARRWKNKLDPNTKRSPWTDEEDVVLKTLVLEFGYEWDNISKYMQGRTTGSIKKRFINSILPLLNQRELGMIQDRLVPKSQENGISMDIEVNSQIKEENLDVLHKKVEDLQGIMRETFEQIEKLESELYNSQSLLS